MPEFLSYRGFHWTHPTMVHWRKEHLVDLSVSGPLSAFTAYCGLFGLFCLLVSLPAWALKQHEFPRAVTGAFGFFLLGSCAASYLAFKLKGLDRGAFDKLLEEVALELTKFNLEVSNGELDLAKWGRGDFYSLTDQDSWGSWQGRANQWLTVLAERVLKAEQENASDPMSETTEKARRHFRFTHQAFERFGLVSGGYQQFFARAVKLLAEEKLKEGPKEESVNGC